METCKLWTYNGHQDDDGRRDEAPALQDLGDDLGVLGIVAHVHVGVKGHQLAHIAAEKQQQFRSKVCKMKVISKIWESWMEWKH